MGGLSLVEHNVHDVKVAGRRLLFHVPTTSLFEMDEVSASLLDLFRERPQVSSSDVEASFGTRFSPDLLAETIEGFCRLDILRDSRRLDEAPAPIKVENFPLSTIVLNVNTGCNLSCSYCYKEDLAAPDKGQRMSFETAVRSFEMLLRQAAERKRINLVFFGGEPLTSLPLIRQVVDYAEARAAEAGKTVDFSLTTNATLLTPAVVDWLDAHRFGITVSMDGPKALHDRNRKTVGGKGTYEVVAAKARMLIERYRSRPVGARVTLTAGVTDVLGIHRHLRDEIGFFEVGVSPATSGDLSVFNLNEAELAQVFRDMKRLGRRYVEAALRNENIGFANMHQLMTDLAEGTKKVVPCGAGIGMLAVDAGGDLHLCHRFTGSKLPTFGNVERGIDSEQLGGFIEKAQDKASRACRSCRIRNLCAGGCYHESYARYEDPHAPVYHYCELMRDWVDFGIAAYSQILQHNPGFIERHLEPRRSKP